MGGPILFGLETEYGFTPLGPDGSLLDRTEIAAELMAEARARVPHLPDVASLGIFLANGSRLYVDRGIHPEVSTPECSDPGELVAYVRAGERVLAEAARAVERGRPGSRILLFACNVEYGGTGETWGCHESYLHRGSNVRMGRSIIPHLVSRIVYTGGGG